MRAYDEQCAREFAQLAKGLQQYFNDIAVTCPYGLPGQAIFHQALFAPLGDRAMELFLASGYRRNGNHLYCMRCPDCSACLPIRLAPSRVRLSRSQRRVLKRNRDVRIEFKPVEASQENIALCDRFLASRYPQKNNNGRNYYQGFFSNMITSTIEIRYRAQGRLIGTAIVDVGVNWMNAVYFFFDPDEARRSLGTLNILTMLDLCEQHEIRSLYLGYLIKEVPAMNYKKRFRPYELLLDGAWRVGG